MFGYRYTFIIEPTRSIFTVYCAIEDVAALVALSHDERGTSTGGQTAIIACDGANEGFNQQRISTLTNPEGLDFGC